MFFCTFRGYTEVGDGDTLRKSLIQDYDIRHKQIVEENEALRRGMHEILESIQQQNGIYYFYLFKIIKLIAILLVASLYFFF